MSLQRPHLRPHKRPNTANVVTVGDSEYEYVGDRLPAVGGPAEASAPGQPIRAMLRLTLRSGADEPPESVEVLADRMTVESGRFSFWHADDLVFRCSVLALISVAFETLDDPLRALSPEPSHHRPHAAPVLAAEPEGPHRAAHHELSSANTRWTPEDERILLDLHSAGVPISELARTFGRRKGAIRARLFKLRGAREPNVARSQPPVDTGTDASDLCAGQG